MGSFCSHLLSYFISREIWVFWTFVKGGRLDMTVPQEIKLAYNMVTFILGCVYLLLIDLTIYSPIYQCTVYSL